MQFSLSAVFLGLATLAVAMPTDQSTSSNGLRSQHEHMDGIRWHVPSGMTVKEAQAKCGDQAQLSCCNKAVYAKDTTDVNSNLGAGLLSNLIGSGSGADGVGIFDQCTKLDLQGMYSICERDEFYVLTTYSGPRHRCAHPGPHQPALQAEHCLLCQLSLLRRKFFASSTIQFNTNMSCRATTLSALACLALLLAPYCKRVVQTAVAAEGVGLGISKLEASCDIIHHHFSFSVFVSVRSDCFMALVHRDDNFSA